MLNVTLMNPQNSSLFLDGTKVAALREAGLTKDGRVKCNVYMDGLDEPFVVVGLLEDVRSKIHESLPAVAGEEGVSTPCS